MVPLAGSVSIQQSVEGKSEKMEMLYNYLAGTEFRQKVEAIVESFIAMRDDLNRERTAMEKIWSKREKQIARVVQNMAGMYGDMQGIIGAALPAIARLVFLRLTKHLTDLRSHLSSRRAHLGRRRVAFLSSRGRLSSW